MSGYLSDPDGDKSSGRLVKVASFLVAVAVAIVGIVTQGHADAATVGLFLAVATAAEVTQKVMGK